MRVPLTGGPPEFVLEGPGISNHQCARLPSTLCVFSEVGEMDERFFSFDPVKGQPQELVKARTQSTSYDGDNRTLQGVAAGGGGRARAAAGGRRDGRRARSARRSATSRVAPARRSPWPASRSCLTTSARAK